MQERAAIKRSFATVFTKANIALIYIIIMLFVRSIKPELNVIAAFAITPAMLYLLLHDEFYVLIAVFIFFYEQLIFAPGAPVFRIYSYLFFAKFIFSKRKINFNLVLLPAVFVIIMYASFAMMNADVSTAVKAFIARNQTPPSALVINLRLVFKTMADLSFVFIIAYILNNDKKLFNKLFIVFVAAAVCSGLYGFRADNVFSYTLGYSANTGATVAVTRYMASFNDPNYAGFFLNIALFAVITSSVFKKLYIKIPLMLVLYYYIIASGSITALIGNASAWVLYLALRYRLKAIPIIAIVSIFGVLMYYTATAIPIIKNISVVSNLEQRLQNQFKDALDTEDSADSAALTSGRTKNWKYYLDYFNKQDIFRKLFGGNIILTSALDPYFAENNGSVPHQAYINFLLIFGIVGTFFIILCFVIKNIYYAVFYLKKKDDLYLTLILCNFMWAFFGLSLDYFPDWKFMFFYFF